VGAQSHGSDHIQIARLPKMVLRAAWLFYFPENEEVISEIKNFSPVFEFAHVPKTSFLMKEI